MDALIIASVVLLAPMLVVATWNVLAAARLERAPAPLASPGVSLLVPARNEVHNLRETLPTFLQLEYPSIEIVVLDDQSEDGTFELVEFAASMHPERLRVVRGETLPSGWTGKNWACHQLAGAATGEFLIFCDADVRVRPGAVLHTVGMMQGARADVLTALPRQLLHDWVQASVVPLVTQLPVLALLPLALVGQARSPAVSMANGQWLAFARNAYARSGGHAAVRDSVLEDIALGRLAKSVGLRLLPVVSTELLAVRMYRSARELRDGFGRSVYEMIGGTPDRLFIALVVFMFAAVIPWLAILGGSTLALAPFGMLAAIRVLGVVLFRHGPASALLHPLGSVLLVWLALESWRMYRRGRARWKGRMVAGRASG